MEKQLNQLIEWHQKFGVPYRLGFEPIIKKDLVRLRMRIMKEEIDEWGVACAFSSKQNRAKELADILYTVFGTVITEGLQDEIVKVFDEVHKSNLSKLDENGKPVKRADGKVLKSPLYKEPDLSFLNS